MAVIGFNFSKFDCVRDSKASGSIEVKHTIHIDKVTKAPLNVGGTSSDVLKVEFGFDVLYGNEVGKISLTGDVIYTDTKEIVEESVKAWDLDKKLPRMVEEQVQKFIYSKVILKALQLSDDLNLPAPIPLPKVNFQAKK
jgi:hypothetical protein